MATVVCSHAHSDHVGATALLQRRGAQVAAHAWDGAMVNARDLQACASAQLDQPVLPYTVDRRLVAEDTVGSGEIEFEVLHTPGHTLAASAFGRPTAAR